MGTARLITLFGWSSSARSSSNLSVAALMSACALTSFANAGCPGSCVGDIDGNRAVDGADLGLVLNLWGTSDACADLDGNGQVDGADLGLLLNSWGDCPTTPLCRDADHDCFTTGGPGCTDIECCETVCAADPSCCEIGWDEGCVLSAKLTCEARPTDCATSDHDCFTTGGPGCSDIECCETVCAADPSCCTIAWDEGCVLSAKLSCEAPSTDCPASDHDCFTTGGPGCTDVECCEAVCAAEPSCCTIAWDSGCVLSAEFSCESLPADCPASDHDCFTTGDPGCTDLECCEVVCAAEPSCCTIAWDRGCVLSAKFACESLPADCPTSDHDCFTLGGPGCTDLECCETVCNADPSCCEIAWDNGCIVSAEFTCGRQPTDCPPSGHDCFTVGGPGCTDIECCQAVCAADPSCCSIAWDSGCVLSAKFSCAGGLGNE